MDDLMLMPFLLQRGPVFEGETPECEYVFSWLTPSACSQTVSAIFIPKINK